MTNDAYHPSDEFWAVVESPDPVTLLRTMPVDALLRFHDELLDTAVELQYEPWSEYMEESEDGREDIAHWVINQGRAYYEDVVATPSRIPHSVEDKPPGALHVGLTLMIYQSRTGEDPPNPY